jgi:hypothetical protein
MNNDIKIVGPSAIKFDRSTGEFFVHIQGPIDNLFYNKKIQKLLKLYLVAEKQIKFSMELKQAY